MTAPDPGHSRLLLGTAPDSWGVWLAEHPGQVPPDRFLAEAQAAGYTRIELGPYGYLPTDPATLRTELDRHGLAVTGGAIVAELGSGPAAFDVAMAAADEAAALLSPLGARFLVLLPGSDRDRDGNPIELSDADWRAVCAGVDRLGRQARRWGMELVFHSHADSLVETEAEIVRLLEGTDPAAVGLCLDTGHVAYGGGDPVGLIRRFPDRIRYVHLKQVDPEVLAQARAEGLGFGEAVARGVMVEPPTGGDPVGLVRRFPDRIRYVHLKQVDAEVLAQARAESLGFGEAVARGVMVEPPTGEPAMPAVLDALAGLDRELICIVEQDMFGCELDRPFPIATRTCAYFEGLGMDVRGGEPARG